MFLCFGEANDLIDSHDGFNRSLEDKYWFKNPRDNLVIQ